MIEMADILSSTNAKSPSEWQEIDARFQNANRRRISSIQRKRVPRIDGIEAMRSLEHNDSIASCSTSSNSFNIILPLTSSDLEIQNSKQNIDSRSSSFSSDSRSTLSDAETVGPSTPRIILTRSEQEEKDDKFQGEDLIYLATHSTFTSKANVKVEEEIVPFHQLPQIVQENPTTKISWAKRTSTHAIIETYMPPTCTTCLSDLEKKNETRKLNRKKVPTLSLSSIQLASSNISPSADNSINSASHSPNKLHSPSTGDMWGIAI